MSKPITLAKAIELTTLFRGTKDTILKPQYVGQEIFTICDTFDRNAFEALLANSQCRSIRIYYGMDSTFKIKPIIVGVDSNDQDILPTGSPTDDNEDIWDDGNRCPPFCPPASPLNEP